MRHEQTIEQIQTYIDDIKNRLADENLKTDEKQHLKRALETYNSLYTDAISGKVDADMVFESITSFMYVIQ